MSRQITTTPTAIPNVDQILADRSTREIHDEEELHESYNRMAEEVIIDDVVKERLTAEHVEQINRAPSDEEINISNLHIPTKKEVASQIAREIITTKNTAIVITSVEELQKHIEEQSKEGSEYQRALGEILRDYQTKKIEVSPSIFFEFIKGSLTQEEQTALEEKLLRFKQIFDITSKTGQHALRENSRDQIIKIVKEQEASAAGYRRYVTEGTIKMFLREVQGRVAYFKPFREFPRLLPEEVWEKLRVAQSKNIFEEFWVLYLDYTKESQNIKSTATKIRDKDPILFGKVTKDSSKCFYIADWVDEYCSLTLDKFVEEMKAIDASYVLPEVILPTPADLGALLEEKKIQEDKLKNTNSSNYRALAASEEEKDAQRVINAENPVKKIWFQRIKSIFK